MVRHRISTDEQGLSGEAQHLLCQELLSKTLSLQAGIALRGALLISQGKSPMRPARSLSS